MIRLVLALNREDLPEGEGRIFGLLLLLFLSIVELELSRFGKHLDNSSSEGVVSYQIPGHTVSHGNEE